MNVVQLKPTAAPSMDTGTIQAGKGEQYMILSSAGMVAAKPAASCLLKPQHGDSVLLSFVGQTCYILAVLEQATDNATLEVKGDMTLTTKTGKIALSANEEVTLSSAKQVSQVAPTTSVLCEQHHVTAQKVSTTCQTAQLHSDDIHVNAKRSHAIIGEVYQKAQQVVRWVEKVETLNIGNLMQNVRNTLSSRSKNASITAKKDIKVDGERIHMG